jgi:hypothetical protein
VFWIARKLCVEGEEERNWRCCIFMKKRLKFCFGVLWSQRRNLCTLMAKKKNGEEEEEEEEIGKYELYVYGCTWLGC